MNHPKPSARDHDAGFTLIELLISITILGILMAALTAAMFVGLNSNAGTGNRLDQSHDEQFIAAYFSGDAQGAFDIWPGPTRPPACKFSDGVGTLLIDFVGEDFTDAAAPTVTARSVSYVRRPAPGGKSDELHRLVCTGGATTVGPGGDTTLARSLRPTWSLSCFGAVAPRGCKGVDLTLKSGPDDDPYEFTLTAYRRTT